MPLRRNCPKPNLVIALPPPLTIPLIVKVAPSFISKFAFVPIYEIPELLFKLTDDVIFNVPLLNINLSESNEPGIDPRLFSEEILKVPEFIPIEPAFVLFPDNTSVPVPSLIKFPDPAIIPP